MKKQKETEGQLLSEMSFEEIQKLPKDEFIRLSVKEYMDNPTPPKGFKRKKPVFHDDKEVNAAILKAKGL